MKKNVLILVSFFLCTVFLAGCSCQHEWMEATCTAAKTCAKCEAVEGEALGHSWIDATCAVPKTCSLCQLTEGETLDHSWVEATCSAPKTCNLCAATEGDALEHIWGEATYQTAAVCSVCGSEGETLPGYFAEHGLTENTQIDQPAKYITNTFVRPDLDTTGRFTASNFRVFESDEKHRAKKGYEWRCVDITIIFSDNHSALYGTNVTCARADYYLDQELQKADSRETFTVNFNEEEYKCTILYENAAFYFTDSSNIFELTCYAQVPTGYDGVILAFYHSGIDIGGMHLHEVEDENMLLLRMA